MQIEICDVAGRTISSKKFFNVESGQQISLNVNSLRQGIYFCKLLSGKQIIRIEKFSKINLKNAEVEASAFFKEYQGVKVFYFQTFLISMLNNNSIL